MAYICPIHGTVVNEFCSDCIEWFANLPDVKGMTPKQRRQEMEFFSDVLTVPFEILHHRIEELAGRSVYMVGFTTGDWKELLNEVYSDETN